MEKDDSQRSDLKGLQDKLKKTIVFRKRFIRGSIFSTLIIGLLVVFGLIFMSAIIGGGSSDDTTSGGDTGPVVNIGLSKEVLSYKQVVIDEANKQGVPDLVPYVLAIMMCETRGQGQDVMQSSESQGHAPGYFSPAESIHYGILLLKNNKKLADQFGIDIYGAIMAYNFGTNYLNYMGKMGLKKSTTEVADVYSKTVVAPALGNTTGATYRYNNPVAIPYNGGYLYTNGGNFFYDLLVKQYLKASSGATASGNAIIDEAQKYLGIPYVWGGHNPDTGLDCSGFVGLVLTKVTGKTYPQYTIALESAGTEVPLSEIKAGDMLFWGSHGATHHVAFYMGNGQVIEEPQPGDVCHIRIYNDGNLPDFAVRPNL